MGMPCPSEKEGCWEKCDSAFNCRNVSLAQGVSPHGYQSSLEDGPRLWRELTGLEIRLRALGKKHELLPLTTPDVPVCRAGT